MLWLISLADQRIRAIEAAALLRRVVEEIEVPLFTFDPDQILRLVNSAGERLLQQPSVRLLGRTAREIGLAACMDAESETIVPLPFQGPNARWLVRRSSFRQKGVPHTLIVLSDVSRALREEERGAWQRLIRVLGHELNNSLTPIKSIAGTLRAQISTAAWETDQREETLSAGSRSLKRGPTRSIASCRPTASSPRCRHPSCERPSFVPLFNASSLSKQVCRFSCLPVRRLN